MSAHGEPAADPLIGQVVDGRYRVNRVIGRGGMGVVYEAEATRLGRRPCALKVLLPEFTRSKNAVARFTREAELAGRVKHANLVEIFDTGTTADGRGYLVMELLHGEGLDRTLRREGAMPWARAQHILLQVCRALAVAHAEKIVHRDMKPENCFRVERDGDLDFIKVLDFGIAKWTESSGDDAPRLTATDAVIGTYAYMAHEQVRGESIDHRVDVWAVGVMVYEMLTGRLPFRGNNQGQIWTAICSYDPEPMQNIAPDAAIPEPAEALVRRALARDRNDRFPTIEALARAIAEIQADGSVRGATGKLDLPAVPASRTPSATFVSGPTAAHERPPRNSRTNPVNPHAFTAPGAAESVDTGESPRGPTELAPPREGMVTAVHELPIEPVPVPVTPTPRVSRGRRRAVWLLAGVGLASLGLAALLYQTTGAPSAPTTIPDDLPGRLQAATPREPEGPAAVDAPQERLDEPPVTAPVTLQPEPAPRPEPVPPPAPAAEEPAAPAEKTTPGTTVTKKPKSFNAQVELMIGRVKAGKELAGCFGNSKTPIDVRIEVTASPGKISVTPVDKFDRDSPFINCAQKVFQREDIPSGSKEKYGKQHTLNGP